MWGGRGSRSLERERGQSPEPGAAGDKAPDGAGHRVWMGWTPPPRLVPLWSGEQMHREVLGPTEALERGQVQEAIWVLYTSDG